MTSYLSRGSYRGSRKLPSSRSANENPRSASFELADLPALLTVKEVARVIRRSQSGTYEWLRSGGLKHIRIQGAIRVLKPDLEEFLASRSTTGGDRPFESDAMGRSTGRGRR